MANSIDLAALGIGVALGYGLRKELQDASGVCKSALLAGIEVAAAAASAGAEAAKDPQTPQSPAPQGKTV